MPNKTEIKIQKLVDALNVARHALVAHSNMLAFDDAKAQLTSEHGLRLDFTKEIKEIDEALSE